MSDTVRPNEVLSARRGTETVLVAEDDSDVMELIKVFLNRMAIL